MIWNPVLYGVQIMKKITLQKDLLELPNLEIVFFDQNYAFVYMAMQICTGTYTYQLGLKLDQH